MPKAEKTRQTSQTTPMSTPAHPRTRRTYPLADADPELHGAKAEMRKQNEDRIRNGLLQLMPPQPSKQVPHHLDHLPSRPQIGMGTKNILDAGRWKQVCMPTRRGCYPHYISDRLDPHLLTNSDGLTAWFNIRAELACQPRSSSGTGGLPSTPILPKGHITLQTSSMPQTSQSSPGLGSSPFSVPRTEKSSSAPQTSQSSSSKASSPFSPRQTFRSSSHSTYSSSKTVVNVQGPNDDLLDKSITVFIVAWIADYKDPIQVMVYPRRGQRLRLDDHKIALGQHGFEMGSPIEYYSHKRDGWVKVKWNSLLPIHSNGEIVLVKFEEVTHLSDWDTFIVDI